jgi:hypothetical protein
MNIKELIALVPEGSRADAEKAISEAVVAANPVAGIDSNEKAAAFIQGNKFFKGALDSEISVKIASHDEKFVKDKLPGLVDAKVRELNPPKDPRDIEIAEIKKQLADRDRKEIEAKQREIALKIAAAEGIPVEGIERFIADNDDATSAQVKAYAKRIKDFRDVAVDEAKKGKYGNNGVPRGGNVTPPADLKTQYEAALKDPARLDEALGLKERLIEAAKNGQ